MDSILVDQYLSSKASVFRIIGVDK